MLPVPIGLISPFDDQLPIMNQAGAAGTVPTDLRGSLLAGPQVRLNWSNTATDATNYSVQRRDATAGGAFAEINLAAPGTTQYDDAGPFTAGHRYQYRIVVVGGAADTQSSNTIMMFENIPLSRQLRRFGS